MSYEAGDKVIIELDKNDADYINSLSSKDYKRGEDIPISTLQFLGKLEDFQPKQEKIEFTPEMKKEFDELDMDNNLANIIVQIERKFPNLERFIEENVEHSPINGILFCKALVDPSLIEVVEPEKYEVELNNGTWLKKDGDGIYSIEGDNISSLTLVEVKEAEKQLGIQGLQDKWYEAAKEKE